MQCYPSDLSVSTGRQLTEETVFVILNIVVKLFSKFKHRFQVFQCLSESKLGRLFKAIFKAPFLLSKPTPQVAPHAQCGDHFRHCYGRVPDVVTMTTD